MQDALNLAAADPAPCRPPDPTPQARALQTAAAQADDLERLQSCVDWLNRERMLVETAVRKRRPRLPRAAQLGPLPGLAPVGEDSAPGRQRDCEPKRELPCVLAPPIAADRFRPGPARRAGLSGMVLLFVVALAITGLPAYEILQGAFSAPEIVQQEKPTTTTSLPATDVWDAVSRPRDEPERLASLPEAELPPAEFKIRGTPSAADNARWTGHSDDKPTGSRTEAGPPQTSPASESSTAIDRPSVIVGLGSLPKRSAAVVLDGRDAKPNIEKEAQPLAAVTCYPSAAAVTHDHPGAWPSWTLHAPGKEGSRCWYAAARAARYRRTELPPKR